MNILIADSGSTKTDWSLTDGQGNVVMTCKTQGINPIHMQDDEVLQILKSELILPESPQEVYFYGSGVTEAMKPRMASLLQQAFPGAKVEAEGDMIGAARALFGNKPGIACILGTGANSCLYDGHRMVMNTPPLGYILEWSGLDYPTIINKVYREPLANRFLASLCPFISQQIAEGEKHENGTDELNEAMALYRVVLGNFNDFYEKNLLPYIEYVKASAEDISQLESGVKAWDLSLGEDVPAVGFVGSIAHYFESPLRNVMCDEHHLTIQKVMQAPMPGLILYHSQQGKQV